MVGLCTWPVLVWTGLHLPSTRDPPCCWAWLGMEQGWRWCWWGCVVECGGLRSAWLIYLFSAYPWLPPCAYWPTLPTSFLAYPGCLWAGYLSTSFALFPDLPWLSLAYPMATCCPVSGYPGTVLGSTRASACPCSLPLFRASAGLTPCYPLPIAGPCPGLSCPAPPIHGAVPRDLSCTWELC